MKRIFLMTGAALLGVSVAGGANAGQPYDGDLLLSGDAEAFGGFRLIEEDKCISCSGNVDDRDAFFAGASGRVSIPVQDNWSVQLDALYEHYFVSIDDTFTEDPRSVAVFGGHANWRDPSRGLFGVFGGYGFNTTAEDDDGDVDEDSEADGWFVGVEGQLYFGDFTLYGQAGYADIQGDDSELEALVDAYFWHAEGRYFIDENTRVSVEAGNARTNHFTDSDDPGEVMTLAVRADTRLAEFDSGSLYGGLGWRVTDATSDDEGNGVHDHAFFASINFLFNAPSLKAADRAGATLSSPAYLYRGSAWSEMID